MRVRLLNGYRVVFDLSHPKAMTSKNWSGFVYEHIRVAEAALGRVLAPDEVVHHEDEDRANNDPTNLRVMTRAEHARLHNEQKYGPFPVCACGTTVRVRKYKYCSLSCSQLASRWVERPSIAQLRKLLKTHSFLELSRRFGVSDNAIRKWLRAVA